MGVTTVIEAIDYKAAALAYWHRAEKAIGQLPDVPSRADYEFDLKLMQESLPVVWPDQFCKIALAGSAQLIAQGIPLELPVIPPTGRWHMWSQPIGEVSLDGNLVPITSVLVYPFRVKANLDQINLAIRAFTEDSLGTRIVFWATYPIYFGEGGGSRALKELMEPFRTQRDQVELANIWGYCLASEMFLNQRVFQSERAHVERHARKRYEKAKVDTEVHVIRLRVVERQYEKQTEAEAVEWTCRWMIRGHWTRQWYPSLGTHKLLWIMPYVKGPKDKPFRAPKPSVGFVVR